jgi:hypothetical protein
MFARCASRPAFRTTAWTPIGNCCAGPGTGRSRRSMPVLTLFRCADGSTAESGVMAIPVLRPGRKPRLAGGAAGRCGDRAKTRDAAAGGPAVVWTCGQVGLAGDPGSVAAARPCPVSTATSSHAGRAERRAVGRNGCRANMTAPRNGGLAQVASRTTVRGPQAASGGVPSGPGPVNGHRDLQCRSWRRRSTGTGSRKQACYGRNKKGRFRNSCGRVSVTPRPPRPLLQLDAAHVPGRRAPASC